MMNFIVWPFDINFIIGFLFDISIVLIGYFVSFDANPLTIVLITNFPGMSMDVTGFVFKNLFLLCNFICVIKNQILNKFFL